MLHEQAALAATLAAGALASLALAAADPTIDPLQIGKAIADLSAVGAVIWLVYHTQTNTIPKLQSASAEMAKSMQETFIKQLAEVQQRHGEHFTLVREYHRNELVLLRDMFDKNMARIEASLTSLQGALRDFGEQQEESRQQAVREVRAAIEQRMPKQ
jgi:hypothetical protein